MITLKLLDSIQSIEKKINKACSEVINQRLNNSLQSIKNKTIEIATGYIINQPEIQSLLDGYLKGAFGKIDTEASVNSIISSVRNSISVNFTKFNPTLTGKFEINVQPSDYANLLVLSEGHTIYNAGDLHWLEWLLLRGDSYIIIDYYYDPKSGIGRTGLGNMKSGGFFRIPPEFSGIESNNFITRALTNDAIINEINNLIKKALL